jgi:hypothetical protein
MKIIENHENKRWIFLKCDNSEIFKTSISARPIYKSFETFNQTAWFCGVNSLVVSVNVRLQGSEFRVQSSEFKIACQYHRLSVHSLRLLTFFPIYLQTLQWCGNHSPEITLCKFCSIVILNQTLFILFQQINNCCDRNLCLQHFMDYEIPTSSFFVLLPYFLRNTQILHDLSITGDRDTYRLR